MRAIREESIRECGDGLRVGDWCFGVRQQCKVILNADIDCLAQKSWQPSRLFKSAQQIFMSLSPTPTYLCLFLLIATAGCSFGVYNLQALGEKSPALLNISYSIANFGFVPYGKTIIGRLMASPNFSSECSVTAQGNNYENSFLLIPRGECEFVTKALNAQRLGAQLAVVMDDKFHEQMIIMADNNYGYKVKIPSIFINHADGQLLRELLEDHPDSSIMMKVTFETRKTDKVDVKFWLQANNRHSYRLVEDFRKYYPLVEQQLNFQVVYSTIQCERCMEEDCYFGKAYCASNLIHEESATGRLVLDQQIREQIVLQLYPQQWWTYMKYFDEQCAPISELKDCGAKVMKTQAIDSEKVEAAVKKSFTPDGDNTFLKRNNDTLAYSGINRFPTVTINSEKVRGSLNAQFIFDDICNTLLNPPEACRKYTQPTQAFEQVSNAWTTLLLVVALGVLIFSIIFILYRRHMKKKISGEMQSRVDDMVSKYIEFYSERTNKK